MEAKVQDRGHGDGSDEIGAGRLVGNLFDGRFDLSREAFRRHSIIVLVRLSGQEKIEVEM